MVPAFLEIGIGKGKTGGFFNLYFELENEEYYYFAYKNSILEAFSKNPDFNNAISIIPVRKRRIKSPDKQVYQFSLSTKRRAENFSRKMKTLLNIDENP